MVCWGLAPVFAKLGLSNVSPMAGLAIRTYISVSLLTTWVLCNGTWLEFKNISRQATWLIAIEAILATLVGDFAYYAALKYGQVTFVTIVMSCSPLVSMIAAVLFLNEEITLLKLLGSVFVVLGLGLVSFKS
jgi:transporter family protein